MFNNIGFKIKYTAKVLFWVLVAAFAISGFGNILDGILYYNSSVAVGGFVTMLVGPALSWVGSILVYGFGQLIENTAELVNLKKQENKEEK